ncbi:MAG: hypothetical protein EA362_06300 [Saprospirales bacterium]|nr:MAG: hypothetical protein EA362_06300 [Saprospirales bacterium]
MLRFYVGLLSLSLFSCTVATTEKIEISKESKDVVQEETLDKRCLTFETARGGQSLIEDFVLYRDFLRDGDMKEAFAYWKNVYNRTPAADGRRWNVFTDGIKFYEWKLTTEDDEEIRTEYKEKILSLYDDMGHCYPEQVNFAKGLKAFDLYYKYRGFKEDIYIFELFKKSFYGFGEDVPPFIINPFTALLVRTVVDEIIEISEASRIALDILDAVNSQEDDMHDWGIVKTYAPQRLADLERVRGFYPCEYYLEIYLPLYETSPEDCETLQLVLSRLIWGNCDEDLDVITEINAGIDQYCVIPVTATSLVRDAYQALRDAEYSKAVEFFQKAIDEESDIKRKADYALVIGKIYYSHLRDFSKSREFAQLASSFRPEWGEPHILIGKLYASSGPLCGPGTGWDSQVVTWVAIDEWQRARSKDSNVAAEAIQLINQYTQYMPSREDIFSRTLNEGASYFVPCWIQRNTTIRAKP